MGYTLFPIGIVYKDAPDKEYEYIIDGNGYRFICVSVNTNYGHLPQKTANYNAKGKLISVGLDADNRHYKFTPKGKLKGYWEGQQAYPFDRKLNARILSVSEFGS